MSHYCLARVWLAKRGGGGTCYGCFPSLVARANRCLYTVDEAVQERSGNCELNQGFAPSDGRRLSQRIKSLCEECARVVASCGY
eukprot:2224132-Amphidinium_carterae.1